MQRVIISDTSCLILLDKIGALNNQLPDWFEIIIPSNKNYQKILEAALDKGEASAIALAIEQENYLLIIDDIKGRKFAEQLGLKITGTLGVLIEAKLSGHLESIKPLLEKIKSTNFRPTAELEKKALEKAGELE